MATWETERASLVTALTNTFKKTGTGAYQYAETDKDITSETNIPVGQKKRFFRVELVDLVTEDLTSGKTIGRYVVQVTLYFISAAFDYETFKSEAVAHLNTLLNTYNYNLNDRRITFSPVENRQATMSFKLEVGLSS